MTVGRAHLITTVVALANVTDEDPVATIGGHSRAFHPDTLRIEWRADGPHRTEKITASGPALNRDGTLRGRAPTRASRMWIGDDELGLAPEWVAVAVQRIRTETREKLR